jgi:peptidoglycan/xylan/chitin deacetylase (PgdA/CDA1 family)
LKRKILLTFDIEEFDLPLEYNCPISAENQIQISVEGLHSMNEILDMHSIVSTCFITSYFAGLNPSLIQNLARKHEIASHSHHHSQFEDSDIEKSKKILEEITQTTVSGFRMPRLQKIDYNRLKAAGYLYDSSLNPAYLPGRYNHFNKPRTIFPEPASNFPIVPMSVSPNIRFPLFWLSFKNIPLSLYFAFCKQCLAHDSYLHLYFHPWEFADISSFSIPGYIKRVSGKEYVQRFEKLLQFLMKQGEFTTTSSFLKEPEINDILSQ